VDIHRDGAVRVEAWEPCSITVDPKQDVLCLTRFSSS
jgi:hypothetical protein